mmetsp:Transcript_34060/g.53079  ORF Transcript_34060/g.53079 Transcript_34060/m.53079 type:complete len:179 (+) Transcript_34060:1310-1846(+)
MRTKCKARFLRCRLIRWSSPRCSLRDPRCRLSRFRRRSCQIPTKCKASCNRRDLNPSMLLIYGLPTKRSLQMQAHVPQIQAHSMEQPQMQAQRPQMQAQQMPQAQMPDGSQQVQGQMAQMQTQVPQMQAPSIWYAFAPHNTGVQGHSQISATKVLLWQAVEKNAGGSSQKVDSGLELL